MKKLLLLFFAINVNAQFPQFVEVQEFTSDDSNKWVQMLNDWADIETEVTGYQSFVLEVMNLNKVYFCRGYETMNQLTDNGAKRWGDDGWNQKVWEKWKLKYPQEKPFESVNPNFVMNHVFAFSQDLSYVPDSMDLESELSKMRFRRNVFLDIKKDSDWNEAAAQLKAVHENDKKLGNSYVSLIYLPMFGGFDDADFLLIVLDESREKYFKSLAKRNAKREGDSEWNDIMKNSVLNWINEEQMMIHY
ncbi:MAG: hypothetical protein ACPGC6_04535 [Flavobacteriaceae bacterium]